MVGLSFCASKNPIFTLKVTKFWFTFASSITQRSMLMRKHILMAIIFQVVFQRNTDNTTSLIQIRMPRNYFHSVWGPSIAGKVAVFYDKLMNSLKNVSKALLKIESFLTFFHGKSYFKEIGRCWHWSISTWYLTMRIHSTKLTKNLRLIVRRIL